MTDEVLIALVLGFIAGVAVGLATGVLLRG